MPQRVSDVNNKEIIRKLGLTYVFILFSSFFLKWVPKGSLADVLEDKARKLRWDDPLLRLAMDVARGMIYLHGREYYDERDCELKSCILHRDLKVCASP